MNILGKSSTTTLITVKPLALGSPVMKSIAISSHICFGIGKGRSNPEGSELEDLAC